MTDRTITGAIYFLDRLDAVNTIKRGDKHNDRLALTDVEEPKVLPAANPEQTAACRAKLPNDKCIGEH